jgi:hypothetical protein
MVLTRSRVRRRDPGPSAGWPVLLPSACRQSGSHSWGRLTVEGLLRGSLAARRSRRISLRWGWFGIVPGRTTASVAARQVRKRHLILVIGATGAPQTDQPWTAMNVLVAGLLPSPWIALLRVSARARLRRPAAQRARRGHRAAGPVGSLRRARRDRRARPGRARGLPAHPGCEPPGSGDTGSP